MLLVVFLAEVNPEMVFVTSHTKLPAPPDFEQSWSAVFRFLSCCDWQDLSASQLISFFPLCINCASESVRRELARLKYRAREMFSLQIRTIELAARPFHSCPSLISHLLHFRCVGIRFNFTNVQLSSILFQLPRNFCDCFGHQDRLLNRALHLGLLLHRYHLRDQVRRRVFVALSVTGL